MSRLRGLLGVLALVLSALACSVECPEDACQPEPSGPAFEYAYPIEGVSGECSLSSQCPDVLLRCSDSDDLVESCESASGVRVYALPGAEDEPNRPFGLASCVDLDCSGAP